MWTWKNWLALAGVVAGSILLSFIVQWHITTGWRVFWLDGLIRWWGDFVMFGWVSTYQTLLAGLLAAAAGGFVLANGAADRREAEKVRNTERYERSFTFIEGVQERLLRMGTELTSALDGDDPIEQRRAHFDRFREELDALDRSVSEATRVGAEFSGWLRSSAQQIRDSYYRAIKPSGTIEDTKFLLAVVFANRVVLKWPDAMLNQEGYYRRHKVPLDEMEKLALQHTGVSSDKIWSANRYISERW